MAAPSRLTKFGLFAALALLCGLALRLFFILRFSAPLTGDTDLYIQFARNWVDHGVYGIWVDGRLTPVDMRAPGYPAFLAVVGALFGRSIHAINIVQAFVDLATCLLIAGMAALLAPDKSRRRVAMAALWLATLCPFTGDYTAAVLTETLAIFLTALALVVFSEARDTPATDAQASGRRETAQGLGAESGGETRKHPNAVAKDLSIAAKGEQMGQVVVPSQQAGQYGKSTE